METPLRVIFEHFAHWANENQGVVSRTVQEDIPVLTEGHSRMLF
jgi:hypothetical protein